MSRRKAQGLLKEQRQELPLPKPLSKGEGLRIFQEGPSPSPRLRVSSRGAPLTKITRQPIAAARVPPGLGFGEGAEPIAAAEDYVWGEGLGPSQNTLFKPLSLGEGFGEWGFRITSP
jgi:hypothetical protein